MATIKIINKYECGCEEVRMELEIPGRTDDIVEHQPRPCMSCLTAQWRKDKEEGLPSTRDMFHRVLEEESVEKGQSEDNEEEPEAEG